MNTKELEQKIKEVSLKYLIEYDNQTEITGKGKTFINYNNEIKQLREEVKKDKVLISQPIVIKWLRVSMRLIRFNDSIEEYLEESNGNLLIYSDEPPFEQFRDALHDMVDASVDLLEAIADLIEAVFNLFTEWDDRHGPSD